MCWKAGAVTSERRVRCCELFSRTVKGRCKRRVGVAVSCALLCGRTADAKEVIGGGWDGSGEHKTCVIGGGLDGCGCGRGARVFLSFLVYLPLRCVGLLLWPAT